MTNFQRKLRRFDGHLPGLPVWRAILVAALVGLQSIQVSVSYGSVLATPLWILLIAVPAALFFLAGYALATSATRVVPSVFLKRRAVELAPIAFVAILTAAFAVGVAATEVPKRSYFTDPDLWLFPAKVLAMLQARLPGVFEFNNDPWTVGANFWMITATALGCALLAVSSGLRWRLPILIAAFGTLLIVALAILVTGSDLLLGGSGAIVSGAALTGMACFVLGALAVHQLPRIPFTLGIALAAGGALGGIAYIGNLRWQGNGVFDLFLAFPIAYLTLYVASHRSEFSRLARTAWPAMSGLPLLTFVWQQFWIAKGSTQQPALINFALSLPPAALLSFLIHYLVRHQLVPRWAPSLARQEIEASGATLAPRDWKAILRRQLSPSAAVQQFQALVPRIVGAILFLLVVLGLMALMMLAMQRDEAGI